MFVPSITMQIRFHDLLLQINRSQNKSETLAKPNPITGLLSVLPSFVPSTITRTQVRFKFVDYTPKRIPILSFQVLTNEPKFVPSTRIQTRIQKTVQLLVDAVKAIKKQSSSSDLCALQQKVASTDSKLDLILAKLSGSNERPPEPEGKKLHKTRSRIKDESLKVPRRKDAYFSKPVTISEPITQPKLSQTDPKDKGKQKIIFKSKKELGKEAQMEIDEELAKQLKAKELKSKQEMLLKRKSSEISTEERSTWHDEQFRVSSPNRTIFFNPDRDSYQKVKVIKPTNSFTPPSDITKEN
ncbi:unnamed protein product [Lactuca virosa]|uniref:Uncharacterized protein n=1 Tax=Lactuca virosa TaxID=75947 RepID=A0AAU9M3P0_9ASTR|nr:unnamed protein product [Lactuca virosa]